MIGRYMYYCIWEFTVGEVHGNINDIGFKDDSQIQVLLYLGIYCRGNTWDY